MSKQPPNDPFEADLQTIENAMNSMMQGAFSMLFKQLVDTTFEDPTSTSTTTTILDGKNLKTADSIVEDDFGGNDFKRLRNKSKQNRGLITSSDEAENNQLQTKNNSSAGPILNLLFQNDQQDQQPRDDKSGWSFTSTSTKTVYQPDGTQETITTKKNNGVTETIKQVRYPDGRTEESREQKSSFWNKLLGH